MNLSLQYTASGLLDVLCILFLFAVFWPQIDFFYSLSLLCPLTRIPFSSLWSCWSRVVFSCLPLSQPSSIWRALSWCCWHPFLGESAGPSHRSSCRKQNLVSAEMINISVSAENSHYFKLYFCCLIIQVFKTR